MVLKTEESNMYPSIVFIAVLGFLYFTILEVRKMEWNLLFFFNSALLGVGLAMDAFLDRLQMV